MKLYKIDLQTRDDLGRPKGDVISTVVRWQDYYFGARILLQNAVDVRLHYQDPWCGAQRLPLELVSVDPYYHIAVFRLTEGNSIPMEGDTPPSCKEWVEGHDMQRSSTLSGFHLRSAVSEPQCILEPPSICCLDLHGFGATVLYVLRAGPGQHCSSLLCDGDRSIGLVVGQCGDQLAVLGLDVIKNLLINEGAPHTTVDLPNDVSTLDGMTVYMQGTQPWIADQVARPLIDYLHYRGLVTNTVKVLTDKQELQLPLIPEDDRAIPLCGVPPLQGSKTTIYRLTVELYRLLCTCLVGEQRNRLETWVLSTSPVYISVTQKNTSKEGDDFDVTEVELDQGYSLDS